MSFIPVTGITLSPAMDQLPVGQALIFTATVTPSNATNKNIIWSRVGGAQCTISQNTNGSQLTLTAQASGTVQIRATIANGILQS